MTTEEKLEKLIAEIERRITFFKEQSVRKTTTDDNSCALALQGVLCFYDSMQAESKKEAVIEVEKIMAEVDAKFPKFAKEVGDIHSCDPHFGVNIEPVSEELEEAATKYMKSENPPIWGLHEGFIAGAKWQKAQFEKNRLKHCNSITNEQAELESDFIDLHLDKYQRMPTFLDAIEYGMEIGKKNPKSHKGKGVECAECADYWKKNGIEIGKKSRDGKK